MADTSGVASAAPAPRAAPAGVTLDRRRVYIFPTGAGWLFAVALAVMLLGAVNYGNSLAYVLTFLLTGLGLVGILHTWRNLAGLRFAGVRCEPVFAGTPAAFLVTLDNRGGYSRRAVAVERYPHRLRLFTVGRPPAGEGRIVLDLEADALGTGRVEVPTHHRGRLPLRRLRLETVFPLGLLRAWSYVDTDAAALVYPTPGGRPTLPPSLADSGHEHHGELHGTDDFVGFRDYQPGDSPRYIAWKAFARDDELVVKRFTGSGAPALRLRWQDTAHLRGTEARLSQLCRWVLEAERQQLACALELPGERIARGHGEAHRRRCLEALALHGTQRAPER